MALSHGGRYYRAHKERELERKRVEHKRLGSAALALLRRNPDRPEFAGFVPTERTQRVRQYRSLDSFGHERTVAPHGEKFWSLTPAQERGFRAYLRSKDLAVPSHSSRLARSKNGTPIRNRTLDRRRRNFLAEIGRPYEDERDYQRSPYGGR